MESEFKENISSLMTKVAGLLLQDGYRAESQLAVALTKVIQFRTRKEAYADIEGGIVGKEEEYYKCIDFIYDYIKDELLIVDESVDEETPSPDGFGAK